MASDRREQVFVSSTYLDLRDERQSVIQALLVAGCIPAGMELFVAGNDEKLRLIQRVISECDYYVLVIGGKYGSIDPATDLSYTEMEYDFAESIGKPILAFVHGEPGQLKGDQLELDTEKRERLDAFRAKVESARVIKYWTAPAELPGLVALSLMETRDRYPAEGWVRASNAMTPEQKTEVAELRAKFAELAQQSSSGASRSFADVDELAQGDDIYQVEVKATGHKKADLAVGESANYQTPAFVWTSQIPVTWNEILQAVGPALLHEASEYVVERAIETWLRDLWGKTPELRPDELRKLKKDLEIAASIVDDVIVQFFALGVIMRGTQRRAVNDKGRYWVLTELGQDQMMKLRAIKRI